MPLVQTMMVSLVVLVDEALQISLSAIQPNIKKLTHWFTKPMMLWQMCAVALKWGTVSPEHNSSNNGYLSKVKT